MHLTVRRITGGRFDRKLGLKRAPPFMPSIVSPCPSKCVFIMLIIF